MYVSTELRPYNDLWLDCIMNNLMAILIHHNPSLKSLPSTFKAEYRKKVLCQKFSSKETYESLLKQGLMLPKVTYNADILYTFFHFEDQFLELADLPSLHGLITQLSQSENDANSLV